MGASEEERDVCRENRINDSLKDPYARTNTHVSPLMQSVEHGIAVNLSIGTEPVIDAGRCDHGIKLAGKIPNGVLVCEDGGKAEEVLGERFIEVGDQQATLLFPCSNCVPRSRP